MRSGIPAVFLLASLAIVLGAHATPIPASFDSAGADRAAIEQLLDTYATAVSNKNERLFQGLLLDPQIAFTGVGSALRAGVSSSDVRDYQDFRAGVFHGSPFTQKFQDVHILQDGPIATVSLVFVNRSAARSTWGWKSLQLLKAGGQWKIASEFYTGHRVN